MRVDSIPERPYHPVRVGLSDAYVTLRPDLEKPVIYRIFYIYSQVNISKTSVVSGSAVVFHPKPSKLFPKQKKTVKMGQKFFFNILNSQ